MTLVLNAASVERALVESGYTPEQARRMTSVLISESRASELRRSFAFPMRWTSQARPWAGYVA